MTKRICKRTIMNPRIDVQYQTLSLPPPYAYAYSIQVELTPQSVEVTLNWQYTDRDELSEEEIWEEGFTPDDDFQWQGSLPPVWNTALSELLEQTTLRSEKSVTQEQDSLIVTFTDADEKIATGVPDDIPRWNYQLQELVQAVYEAAQRERPLRIRYLDIDQGSAPREVTIDITFLHRRFTVTSSRTSQGCPQKLPWDRAHSLLESLYLPDYHSEQSSGNYPRQPGQYIDPGDENWYQLGRSVVNPGKNDVLSVLHQTVLKLIPNT